MEGLIALVIFIVMLLFARYIFVVLFVLTGDKQGIKELGNLCNKEIPWQDNYWLYTEKYKDKKPPWHDSLKNKN
jgi:hypothetical protein